MARGHNLIDYATYSGSYDNNEGSSFHVDQISAAPRTPWFVYLLTLFSAIGGFLFGYDTGVISGAMLPLRNEFVLNSVWQEIIVGVTIGAAAIFAIVGACANDWLGRKPVIVSASLIFAAGSLCMALAQDRYLLLTGRVIVGIGIGLTSTTTPMYIAEASPALIRGRLVSTNIAMVACGQFVANVVDGIFSTDPLNGWSFVLTFGLGLVSMTAPVYVSEAAPKTHRGLLVTLFTVFLTAGQLTGAISAAAFRDDKKNGWRYMLGLGGIPAFIQFVGFLFMPESPRWLIIKERDDEAKKVLQKIRATDDIEDEYESIRSSCMEAHKEDVEKSRLPIIYHMIRIPSVRRALIVGCSLQMVQQVAGINTVMYYSATVIRLSGVKDETIAIWLSAVTAAVNFSFTFVGLYLVEKIGRRPLTLGSLIGAIVSLIWLAVGFQLAAFTTPGVTMTEKVAKNSSCASYSTCNSCMRDFYCGYCYVDTPDGAVNASCLPSDYNNPLAATLGRCNRTHLPGELSWAYDYCPTDYSWMAVVGLVLYLIFFAPGMGPMPWTINSEIYPLWARSTGCGAATFTNWAFNLLISMSFLSLTDSLTRFGTFWLYAGLAILGLLFLVFFLPETKGKSLEEVEGLFAKPWCGNGAPVSYTEKSVQYVHIRGLNRDGRESELDSPE